MNIIEAKTKNELIKSYAFRLKAYNISFKLKELKNAFNDLSGHELMVTLNNMVKNRDNALDFLTKRNIKYVDKGLETSKLKQMLQKELSLKDVTEFESEDKDYFKFKGSDNQVFIVRNLGDDSRALFLNMLNASNINLKDGRKNADEIFRLLKEKKFIEVKLEGSSEIKNNPQYGKVTGTIAKEMEKKFPDKEVLISPKENLYVIKGNPDEKDLILNVQHEDNKLKVKPVTQKTYGEKNEININQDNEKTPNDTLQIIENDIDVQTIIDEGLDNSLSNNDIINAVENSLKNRNINILHSNLISIINAMIARAKQKRQTGSQNMQSKNAKQYVLRSNNYINLSDDNAAA